METYISELLYRHDCVILPGLGGLITNYRSAKIHPVSHTIQPPSKSIRFNVNLQEDDGLLANYVASCEAISFASAQSKIERFVFSIQNDLEHKQEALLPKIGVLSRNVNGSLSFEPDLKVNYLLDSFGLDAIQSPPILKKSTAANLSKQMRRGAKTIQSQKGTFNWKVAAVLLPLIGLSSYVSFQQDAIKASYANYAYLNPFKEKPAAVYIPRTVALDKQTATNEQISTAAAPKIVVAEPVKVATEVVVKKSPVAPSVATSFVSKPFHLIAGCFSSQQNANNLVRSLKTQGFHASVVGKSPNGLVRVAFQSFESRELALVQMEKLKSAGKSTWLLRQ